jgi:cytochrome c oxidase assembly protein subunit 15
MASLIPILRPAAPRLSRDFFICHQCMKQSRPTSRQINIPSKSTLLRNVRFNSSAATLQEGGAGTSKKPSPLGSLSQTISGAQKEKARASSRKFFPETSSKGVAYWLLGSAASVFGIVVFGGLTRLTESGYASASSARCQC